MKFIINTSIDPHFCVLFDESARGMQRHTWMDRKTGGRQIWEFLRDQKIHQKKLSFLGGISGPGGFSCLRVAAAALNSLAFAKKIPTHSIRADQWIRIMLKDQKKEENFVLNSFGDSVFVSQGKKLRRLPVREAASYFKKTPVFIDFLPPEKQKYFQLKKTLDLKNMEKNLLEALASMPPCSVFLPEYESPSV